MQYDLKSIISRFEVGGSLVDAAPYGSGHINDTFASVIKTAEGNRRFIHQRINHNIFKKPEQLMDNIERVTTHIRSKLAEAGGDTYRGVLTIIPTSDSTSFYRCDDGNYWRTYRFIENAQTYDQVEKLEHVYNASKAFGLFQKQISDLPGPRLHETIVNFHNTKARFARFQEVLSADGKGRAASVKDEIDFVLSHEGLASKLVDMMAEGKIPERITHNDTKLNNVMIDDATGEGLCVIDLDTVMPGAAMYDFGDSVRIGASTAAEDEKDLSKVNVDLDMFERLAGGYLCTAKEFLAETEVSLLALSCRLLTFECGMRFLTDYLEGDVYFKVHREGHNLDRCRTQFKMVAEMENKSQQMEEIVSKYSS